MRKGLSIYRGLVVRSSVTTGELYVRIPELLGPTEAIQIARDYIYSAGGLWDVPPERSQVLIGLEGERIRNAFIIKILGAGAIEPTESPLDDIIQSIEDLETDVSNLETTVTIKSPVGAITDYIGETAPNGWLFMHGQTITSGQTLYPLLWSVLPSGMKSGANIVLPDTRGKVLVDKNSSDIDFDNIGKTGGAKAHTLTTSEMPSHGHIQDAHNHTQDAHNHTQNAHTHTQNSHFHTVTINNDGVHAHNSENYPLEAAPGTFQAGTNRRGRVIGGGITTTNAGFHNHGASIGNETATNQNETATNQNATATNQNTTATNQNTGGGSAHNNLQPYIVTSKIICAV